MDTALLVTVLVVYQCIPLLLIWFWRARNVLSIAGATFAAGLTVLGTAAAWYIGFTDTSSTLPVLMVFAPLYLVVAVVFIAGLETGARAGARRWRHH